MSPLVLILLTFTMLAPLCSPFRPLIGRSSPYTTRLFSSDTIFALSTLPPTTTSHSAIGIVRLAGPDCLRALNDLSVTPKTKPPTSHKFFVRSLADPVTKVPLDTPGILYFKGPKSYTGNDVIELHLHNSYSVVISTLATLASLPYLRPADPGEFTSLALSNGKLSLLDVESLSSLLTAVTTSQRTLALTSSAASFALYEGYAKELLKCLAHAEAIVDFSDDAESDVSLHAVSNWSSVLPRVHSLLTSMRSHLNTSTISTLLSTGVRVALYGDPNVGKSSIINALTKEDTSIVSTIPGTTRDAVTATLDIGGYKCTIVDTAGIRETDDVVESMGIERTLKEIERSDVRVQVVEYGTPPSLHSETEADVTIVNKVDLAPPGTVGISCKTGDGLEALIETLTEIIKKKTDAGVDEGSGEENVIVTQTRHANHIKESIMCLERFLERVEEGSYSDDLAAEELRRANTEVARIMGKVDVEAVLDVLFKDFCIGK